MGISKDIKRNDSRWCEDAENLASLRYELKNVDFKLLDLVTKRMWLCGMIGELKVLNNLPICDPAQEKKVLETRIAYARSIGLDADFVKSLLNLIMGEAKEVQSRS